jgi:hypothetical protein
LARRREENGNRQRNDNRPVKVLLGEENVFGIHTGATERFEPLAAPGLAGRLLFEK